MCSSSQATGDLVARSRPVHESQWAALSVSGPCAAILGGNIAMPSKRGNAAPSLLDVVSRFRACNVLLPEMVCLRPDRALWQECVRQLEILKRFGAAGHRVALVLTRERVPNPLENRACLSQPNPKDAGASLMIPPSSPACAVRMIRGRRIQRA
jgi:hypothetical protein